MILLSNAYDAEMADRAPEDPVVMENAIGVANLVLFFFFLLDMFLQFMIQGSSYITGSTIKFTLDVLATFLLLPTAIFFDQMISDIVIDTIAGGDESRGQTIVDNIQQGTVARLSRVARLASRLTRVIKSVSALQRYLLRTILAKQSSGGFWSILAKACGVVDEAAKELEAAEKAREQQQAMVEKHKQKEKEKGGTSGGGRGKRGRSGVGAICGATIGEQRQWSRDEWPTRAADDLRAREGGGGEGIGSGKRGRAQAAQGQGDQEGGRACGRVYITIEHRHYRYREDDVKARLCDPCLASSILDLLRHAADQFA